MSRNITNRRLKIRNLGRMHHSMLDSYFDEELKQLFVESYAADGPDSDISKLLAQVKKYSNVLSARRKQIQY